MDKYLGKRLDGRYEIREIIGVGGMAVVYKAFDNVENRFVAIKILKEEFLSNQEFLRRFKNESKAIAMLSHPNIVNVYDVSFGDLIQYIVMEYIEGITLKEYIEREGSLRWKDAVHFTIQILKGLQHAHDKGIVHRDVKPQNIMVLNDGTIKVTDFGIARFARSDQRTITDKAIGSVHYISPEQARGEKTDEKTDIYSVGVMLYEMLTGKLPFQAESAVSVAIMQLQRDPQLPSEINGSIPLGLEQITMHAMQKSQERRYQSASEILCDLTNFRKDPAIVFPYSYFVDDSPTKFVGGNDPIIDEPEEEVAPAKEKSSLVPILTGVAAAVVVAMIFLGIYFLPKLFSNTGKEFSCDDFVGMKVADIEKDSELNDKYVFEYKYEPNNDYEEGVVFKQSIPKGDKLKKGAKITLYVSDDRERTKVPDVSGMTESAAISQLESVHGFQVKISSESSDEFEAGMVIRTDPIKTTVVPVGSTVTIFVSTGKEEVTVDVPNVIGEPVTQAKTKLSDAGLKYTIEYVNITPADGYHPKDYVIRQDPQGGTEKVSEGTNVTLYVSSGIYETDITISLPKVYPESICSVSLWRGSSQIQGAVSTDFVLAETPSYTFKDITSEKGKETLYVKIKGATSGYSDYMTIEVDFTKQKDNINVLVTETFDGAPDSGETETETEESF